MKFKINVLDNKMLSEIFHKTNEGIKECNIKTLGPGWKQRINIYIYKYTLFTWINLQLLFVCLGTNIRIRFGGQMIHT